MSTNALIAVAPDLWCLGSYFVTWGCRGSTRMTVIRTADGLVLHSPVAMTPDDIGQVSALGEVRAIIAPNLFHHMSLRAAMAGFPAARVFVPQGLETRIGPIEGARDVAGFDGGPDLETCTVSGHRLNETVLFHRPTGTLVTADLLYNFQPENFLAEKLFFRAIGCYGKPAIAGYHRLAVTDKAAVRQAIATIAAWPIRRIIMSHGRIIEDDNAARLFADIWRKLL